MVKGISKGGEKFRVLYPRSSSISQVISPVLHQTILKAERNKAGDEDASDSTRAASINSAPLEPIIYLSSCAGSTEDEDEEKSIVIRTLPEPSDLSS
jgi:hypothetical protein